MFLELYGLFLCDRCQGIDYWMNKIMNQKHSLLDMNLCSEVGEIEASKE